MPTKTLQTVVQAWQSLLVDIAALVDPTITGYTFTWTSHVGATPGYFTSAITNPGGTVTTLYQAVETSGTGVATLDSVLRQPGWQATLRPTAAGAPFAMWVSMPSALMVLKLDCLADVCGASHVSMTSASHTTTGSYDPTVVVCAELIVTSTDIAMDCVGLFYPYLAAAGGTALRQVVPAYGSGAIIVSGPISASSADGNPLDLDVSIDQGSSIFSIVSRDLTTGGQ